MIIFTHNNNGVKEAENLESQHHRKCLRLNTRCRLTKPKKLSSLQHELSN